MVGGSIFVLCTVSTGDLCTVGTGDLYAVCTGDLYTYIKPVKIAAPITMCFFEKQETGLSVVSGAGLSVV